MNAITGDLFAIPMRRIETPAARRSDPESSHRAAVEITASGARAHQQAQTIAAVRAFPGCTTQELAELTGLDRYALARRAPECVTAGAIRKGEQRTCAVTGRLALTWWVIP